jgi:hypothetical protein
VIPYGRLERMGDVVDTVNIYFTLGDVGVGSDVLLKRKLRRICLLEPCQG